MSKVKVRLVQNNVNLIKWLMPLVITALVTGCNRPPQDSPAISQGLAQAPTALSTSPISVPSATSAAGNTSTGGSGMSGATVNSATAISTSTPQASGPHERAVSSCSSDETAGFTRDDGERFDPMSLPTGLYVASTIQLFLEKTNAPGEAPSRALVREVIGSDKGVEIVCADGLEKFGNDFDFSVTGLVKFVASAQKVAGDFSFRQVFFYQNKLDTGAIVSNPQLTSQAIHAAAGAGLGLTELLHHGGGQLFRLADSTYRLKYVRDRDSGLHAKLIIDLDAN